MVYHRRTFSLFPRGPNQTTALLAHTQTTYTLLCAQGIPSLSPISPVGSIFVVSECERTPYHDKRVIMDVPFLKRRAIDRLCVIITARSFAVFCVSKVSVDSGL